MKSEVTMDNKIQEQFICSKMFTDLNIRFSGSIVKNCCKSSDNLIDENNINSDTILRDPILLTRKESMVRDNVLPRDGCNTCVSTEPHSLFRSWNTFHSAFTQQEKDSLLVDDNIRLYEFVLSSACDLKCIYCDPKDSSSWAKELNVPIYKCTDEWRDTMLEQIYMSLERKTYKPNTVYQFFFSGGEPTYNTDTLPMIKHIISIVSKFTTKIQIVITTNLNTKPTMLKKFIEVIKRYPNVIWRFDASFESVGEQCEAIRHGLIWGRAIINMKSLLLMENVTVTLNPAINLYSIPSTLEFLKFFDNIFQAYRKELYFGHNMVMEDGLSPTNLPVEYTVYIQRAIDFCNSKGTRNFESFAEHLENIKMLIGTKYSEENNQIIENKLRYFEEKRPETNWRELFPHVVDLIKDNNRIC